MNSVIELRAQLDYCNNAISFHKQKSLEIKRQIREIGSRQFIEENEITIDQVERSRGDGKPRFTDVRGFANWLKDNSDKKWCEWNTGFHLVKDLIDGKWVDPVGWMSELDLQQAL